jgi:hypothetical protein
MFGFAIILFLVSPIAFLAGLVNPKWVLRGEKRTRLKSSLVYSGVFVGSFVTIGLTAPPQSKNASVPSPSASPSVTVSPQSAPKAAKQVSFTSSSAKPVGDVGQPTAPVVASPSSKSQHQLTTIKETANWSDELCQGDRYFPAKGASTAQYNSCQYIKSDSLKLETIVLATGKDSENVADSMVDKGFKKVDWKDGFNPLVDQSTSACIVYVDKSVACHKGEGSNLNSNEMGQSTAQTASSTSVGSDEAVLTANDPDSQINLRDTPSTTGKDLGYGVVGDRVEVIEQITIDGYIWHKLRFPRSGAVGWVRGDFVSVVSASKTSQASSEPPTYSSSSQVTDYTPAVATSGGSCNSPDDLDSQGHRCGGRAKGVRGGRKRH